MDPAQPQPKVPPHLRLKHQKIIHVLSTMNLLNLSLKKFLVAFLTNQHTKVKIWRALWGSPDGWPSTQQLLNEIHNLVISNGHKAGKQNWKKFILEEACQSILFNALSPFLLTNPFLSFVSGQNYNCCGWPPLSRWT
jgi:hypothetical protein